MVEVIGAAPERYSCKLSRALNNGVIAGTAAQALINTGTDEDRVITGSSVGVVVVTALVENNVISAFAEKLI